VRPGEEARALTVLVRLLLDTGEPAVAGRTGVTERALGEAARRLADAASLAVVVGPRVFDCPGAGRLAADLEALAARQGVTIVPLVHGTNARGALELGALADVLPGPRAADAQGL